MLFPDELAQTTSVDVVSERQVIPGGQSVGIQMEVEGALIVGVEKDTGAQVGDMIVEVNEQEVSGPEDVIDLVGTKGDAVELTVVRDKKRLQYTVTPYFDEESESYKLGFWIKERIAGIGTLTFYDAEHKTFGALGHGIYEPETGSLLETKEGSLLHTKVNQVKSGVAGTPGELGGVIYDFNTPIGTLEKNIESGVYGTVEDDTSFQNIEPMSIGTKESIKTGSAYILSTIDGTKVEKFEIQINKVHKGLIGQSRGLEIEVTDEKLLEKCGGIVQGMSGSPVIQNGRIVGAVTHVLVNDPTRGYGIFIENMLEAAK
ncbi:MAG: SpoIVB peptidase [Firmicutes bacterium]|nr:SpoIVB peptidase [Bacillota bacterium]